MINKWNEYSILNENLTKARSILRSIGLKETDQQFLKLKELLSKHPGYLGKFTEWLYKDKVSLDQLSNLYRRIMDTKLTKAIDQYKSPEEVIDSIVRSDADTAVNQMINAIPSRARDFLKTNECHYCDGDKMMTCEKCDGECSIYCEKCDGDGEIECTVCDSNGLVECKPCKGDDCKKCNGDEEVECKDCKGNGTIKCTTCGGKCEFECKDCKGKGTEACTHCVSESEEWISFKKFLALQKDNKDIIIDLFSKKGGRYGEDNDNGEDRDETIDRIKKDISRLINCASIEDVKLDSIKKIVDIEVEEYERDKRGQVKYTITKKKLPSIAFIYDDDKYLIVAVNYNGIKKYGSSYWCITEDEDTFNDYVYNGEVNLQLILFIKGKLPFIDDKSVMGITYGVKGGEVEAAHWEDDSEADPSKILKSLKIDKQNLFNALSIYEYEDDQLDELIVEFPLLFSDKIENIIKENIAEITKKRPNKGKLYGVCNLLMSGNNDIEEMTPLINLVKELLNKYKFKFPVNDIDILELGIINYVDFNKDWLKRDLSVAFGSLKAEEKETMFKFLKENNYDFKKFGKIDIEYFVKNKILPLPEICNLIRDWDLTNLDGDVSCLLYNWVLDNNFDFILTSVKISKIFIKYISVNEYIDKYRSKIVENLRNNKFKKEINDFIIDEIDDDEIDVLAARNLINKRLNKKYQIDFKRFEGMMSFKDFKKI
jgi:hypothetical protein